MNELDELIEPKHVVPTHLRTPDRVGWLTVRQLNALLGPRAICESGRLAPRRPGSHWCCHQWRARAGAGGRSACPAYPATGGAWFEEVPGLPPWTENHRTHEDAGLHVHQGGRQ